MDVNEQDKKAYSANVITHTKGLTHQDMVNAYSQWANKYDADLCPGRYNGPEISARVLAEVYPPEVRNTVRILDVAAGTGRVGIELNKRGFRNVDGLEPSPEMLEIAISKNVYKETVTDAVGYHQTTIPKESYDCLISSGGMGQNHIPVVALDEMIRLTKKGGFVCIVMREEYLQTVEEYKDKLEPYMDLLEKNGKWKRILRDVVANYSFNKNGLVHLFRVV